MCSQETEQTLYMYINRSSLLFLCAKYISAEKLILANSANFKTILYRARAAWRYSDEFFQINELARVAVGTRYMCINTTVNATILSLDF